MICALPQMAMEQKHLQRFTERGFWVRTEDTTNGIVRNQMCMGTAHRKKDLALFATTKIMLLLDALY
jgi:hypothetical protein